MARPVAGSGPGQARFFWINVDGEFIAGRWAHNEYLQWLVDYGVVGLVLLAAVIVSLALLIRAGRLDGGPLWAGAAAGVVALAAHSAFDFLWEPAVIPLLIGVLAGLCRRQNTPFSNHGEDPQ